MAITPWETMAWVLALVVAAVGVAVLSAVWCSLRQQRETHKRNVAALRATAAAFGAAKQPRTTTWPSKQIHD